MLLTTGKQGREKSYADVVKVTKAQPLISENKSTHGNKKDGENQLDLEKIKSLLNTQDRELLDILEQLGNVGKAKGHDLNVTSLGRLRGHFCSDTVFNLSHRVLPDAEIRLLEKG